MSEQVISVGVMPSATIQGGAPRESYETYIVDHADVYLPLNQVRLGKFFSIVGYYSVITNNDDMI